MRKLYIIGAGGHGKVVAEAAQAMEIWSEIYFIDDHKTKGAQINGISVLGPSGSIDSYLEAGSDFIVAIGSNATRADWMQRLQSKGARLATIIHPSAIVSPTAKIGAGSVVLAGSILNASVQIGLGCIINTAATVDHDCVIGPYCHLSPAVHLAGEVQLGRKAWLGLGVSVINQLRIGPKIVVGAGAVVTHSLKQVGTYVGIPAHLIKD